MLFEVGEKKSYQSKIMRVILIFITASCMLSSCLSEDKGIAEMINKIEESGYLLQYEGWYLKPVHRRMNVIVVGINKDDEYYVRNFYAKRENRLKVSEYLHPSLSEQNIEDSLLHKKIHKFLLDSYCLDILRYVDTGHSKVLHVNVSPEDIDRDFNKVKYVLVKSNLDRKDCYNDLVASKEIYDIKDSLYQISDDWYYYYSELFNKYDCLEDFN